MTAQVLPVTSDVEHYTFQTVLSDTLFGFRFDYSQRDDHWYMSLYDDSGVAILEGLRVTLGAFYLYRVATLRRPAGVIMAFDTTNKNLDPGRNDLGGRVRLLFV